MKKHLIISICLFTLCGLSAQVQQGIVKTKGRLNPDGSVTAGVPLSDAFVTVRGAQTVTSNKQGQFSVSLKTRDFYLKEVSKEGYALCDADALSRSYAYSKSPLYIVMETPSQQLEDKLIAERRLRKTLQKQLQRREEEIDSLKASQQITDEEYRQALQQIYSEQEENERLIGDMSERYAKIDYDQLDEFNQRISNCILEGKLMEADSLIRSKGDMRSRVSAFFDLREQNQKEEERLKQGLKKLEKNKAYERQELEDLAQDCYSLFEIFKMQHKNDSAAYYLELRASLDTTTIAWQLEAGDFYKDYLANCKKAMELYQRALSNPDICSRDSSMIYNCLGSLYIQQGEYQTAINLEYKALNIQMATEPISYSDLAATYCELGTAYYYMENLDSADICFEKDASITMQIYGNNHYKLAITYGNIAEVKVERGDYELAIEYNIKSLKILQQAENTDKIQLQIATTYNNLGSVYRKIGDYENDTLKVDTALYYLHLALEIRKNILGERNPLVASTYNNLANAYDAKNDTQKALEYSLMDIDIVKEIYGEDHPDLAISYGNLALIYKRMKNYELAMKYNLLALQLKLKYYPKVSTTIAGSYNNIGTLYYAMGKYELSKQYLTEAYDVIIQIVGPEHRVAKIIEQHIKDVEEELSSH